MKTWAMAALLFSLGVDARGADPRSWDNLRQLKADQKIRVDYLSSKWRGTFVGFSDEAISLRWIDRVVTVPRAQVVLVSTPSRKIRLRNTLIGLGIGGAIGGSILAGNAEGRHQMMGGLVDIFAVFVIAGTAGVGSVLPANRTIYKSPAAGPAVTR